MGFILLMCIIWANFLNRCNQVVSYTSLLVHFDEIQKKKKNFIDKP
jgi:hypothetical protein